MVSFLKLKRQYIGVGIGILKMEEMKFLINYLWIFLSGILTLPPPAILAKLCKHFANVVKFLVAVGVNGSIITAIVIKISTHRYPLKYRDLFTNQI